ncbi:MAG: hypothetical protein FWF02_04330 [Micrococcales bacterium]|nr:hypothetical protein [Micrococcales bacterium]MCL2666919.1 hypothetical protein [Micrococcales bacterium]
MNQSFIRRTAVLLAAAVVTAGLAAGCTSDDGGNKGKSSDTSTLGAQKVDLTQTIGQTQEFPVPGKADAKVEVGVLSLKVAGDVQTLELVFTPRFANEGQNADINLGTMLGGYSGTDFGPRLIDQENLKIYSAVRVSPGNAKTVNYEPLYVYAVFAAPKDSSLDYDLSIIAEWPPMKVRAEK